MRAGGPGSVRVPTRRAMLVGAAWLAATVAGCTPDDDGAIAASAAKGGDRRNFVDTVGWIEIDGLTAVIAFTPYPLSDEQRRAVVNKRSVYPSLPSSAPVLEMRLEIKPGRKRDDLRINLANLRSIQFTYWYFDDPTPVVRIEQADWPPSAEIEIAGLDGDMRRGGYLNGNIRSRQIYRGAHSSDEAYLVNARFAVSLQ